MDYRDYITIDPNKRGGKPCVRGLRITVYEVLEYLASDMTEAQILEDFPELAVMLRRTPSPRTVTTAPGAGAAGSELTATRSAGAFTPAKI